MAGSASSWYKVQAGPVVGASVYVPPSLKGKLTGEQVQQQLAGGYGGWLNELPPGPLVPPGQLQPAFDPHTFAPNTQQVPLVVTQADGDHAVKQAKQMGALAVVDTPFGHSIVHTPSGKALLYVGNQGKPTPETEQQATLMMVSLNSLYGEWAQADPEKLDHHATGVLSLAEGSGLGKFKQSKWVQGKGPSPKKKLSPNDTTYQAFLAAPSLQEPATDELLSPAEQAAPNGTQEQSTEELASVPVMINEEEAASLAVAPDEAPSLMTIQVMPNVYDEEHKKPLEAEVEGPFAIHQDLAGHGWTLTHVASGYPMAVGFKTKVDAQEGLQLAAASALDWNYSDKKALMANKANFDKAAALGKKLRKLAEESTKPKPVKVEPAPWKPKGDVKTFPSLEAHDNAVKAAYGSGEGFVRGTVLGKSTQKAIASYQDGGYGAINSLLWGAGPAGAGADKATVKQIQAIDEAMSLSSVPFNMVVVRSHGQSAGLYQQMSVLEVGDIYQTPAFDSASINHNNEWGGGSIKVFYRLPQGAKAIFMNALGTSPNAPGYKSSHKNEYECLIARNSRWRLVGKEVDSAGRITVTVELVDQQKPKKGE